MAVSLMFSHITFIKYSSFQGCTLRKVFERGSILKRKLFERGTSSFSVQKDILKGEGLYIGTKPPNIQR